MRSFRTLLLLAAAFFSCRPSRPASDPSRAELSRLQARLSGLDFSERASEALLAAENLAHRSQGQVAVEAWYLVGRHRLDWLLAGVLGRNGKRIRDLLAHLGQDTACCRGDCFRDGRLVSTRHCLGNLRDALTKPFRAIRRLEGGGDLGYAGLARELEQVVDLVVRPPDPVAHARLLGERDPAGTRARLLFACRLAGFKGLETDLLPGWWRRRLPLSCRIPEKARLEDLQRALLAGGCDYPCKGLVLHPVDPLAFWQRARESCPHTALGFDRPKDAVLFGPTSYVAAQILRLTSRTSRFLAGESRTPIVRRFAGCGKWLASWTAGLEVPVGLPPVLRSELGEVAPPRVPAGAWLRYRGGPVLVVGPTGWSLTEMPRLLADRDGEIRVALGPGGLFGRRLPMARRDRVLKRMLSDRVSDTRELLLYADKRMPVSELAAVTRALGAVGIRRVVLAVVRGDLPEVTGGLPIRIVGEGKGLGPCGPGGPGGRECLLRLGRGTVQDLASNLQKWKVAAAVRP